MRTTNLGFPNSYNFAIKKAVEGLWQQSHTVADIDAAVKEVTSFNLQVQNKLDLTPVNDIDIYDRFLKTAVLFGIAPTRFGNIQDIVANSEKYLAIARGTQAAPASPMVKWFNTNYHVVQPEIEQEILLQSNVSLPQVLPRQKLALIGPFTLLQYAINKTALSQQELFASLASQYAKLINSYPSETIIQLEEPSFVTNGIPSVYQEFIASLNAQIHLHVYFGAVNSCAQQLFALDVAAIGLDFIDGVDNLSLLAGFPQDKLLIAGIINGRNVWSANSRNQHILQQIQKYISDDKLYISPSCSLMHLPVTNASDEDGEFVFAREKIAELIAIAAGTLEYKEVSLTDEPLSKHEYRRSRQGYWVSDRDYPTTTIGSFPQTAELRKIRKQWKDGSIDSSAYETYVKGYIKNCIKLQEDLELDVLVHGEPERADMVQYFAENFNGMTVIKGAVQSYGTRYVKPPVITGNVTRPRAFSVPWSKYAQQCTTKPVKGMLTGPVTLVQWSFPREDISRLAQMYDIAGALAAEVNDLVAAGIKHIQIDEPALREGLPLDREKWSDYLFHAVNAFRKSYAAVGDDIVIHSHMCFSNFPDIMAAICDMGVDVLSVEDSKAKGKTAKSVRDGGFPASIGLGVYDVHSPRVPSVAEMVAIPSSLSLDPKKVWINPDCGLKTRDDKTAYQQLSNMMTAVKQLRTAI